MSSDTESAIAWLPDLLYAGGRFQSGVALVSDSSGVIARLVPIAELRDEKRIRLANRAVLPGMINAHSHAFQRVLRGRTEYRTSTAETSALPNPETFADSFWTW